LKLDPILGGVKVFITYDNFSQDKLVCCILDISRKTRILDVVFNASSNELVRTKTLVKVLMNIFIDTK